MFDVSIKVKKYPPPSSIETKTKPGVNKQMKKHQEHIVAVAASLVTTREQGICNIPDNIEDHIVIKRRASLLNDFNYRKLIPLTVFMCNGKIAAFTRKMDHQHEALRGKVTVGIGGHFELGDLCHKNSVIDIEMSVLKASAREVAEEVIVGEGTEILKTATLPLVIAADETITDRQYMALVSVVQLTKEDVLPNPEEDELDYRGWYNPAELLDSGKYTNETWTNKICSAIDSLGFGMR